MQWKGSLGALRAALTQEERSGMSYDPLRQLQSLKQILAQDKARIGFLLCAGCGVALREDGEPVIPDIGGLTKSVTDRLAGGDCKAHLAKALSHFEEDKRSRPNIEELLSHIRSLEQVAGCGEVRGLKSNNTFLRRRIISRPL